MKNKIQTEPEKTNEKSNVSLASDLHVRFHHELFDKTYSSIQRSGKIRINEEERAILLNEALMIAREQFASPFDPEKNYHDKIKIDEFLELVEMQKKQRSAIEKTREEVRQRQDSAAELSHLKNSKPQLSRLFITAATIGISIKLIFMLHGVVL